MKWHSSLVTHDRSGGVAERAESHLHVSLSLFVFTLADFHMAVPSHPVVCLQKGESLQVFGLSA